MSEVTDILDRLPEVSFIDNKSLKDVLDKLKNDYETKYEELTNEKNALSNDFKMQSIIQAFSLLMYQIMQYIDKQGKSNLLKYSYGSALDGLGAFKSVFRNEFKKATSTIRFSISESKTSNITIPKGTQAATKSKIHFESLEDYEIISGNLYVDVIMQCTQDGTIGNNLAIGDINILVNKIPYIEKVENITISSGGSEPEEDIEFLEKIYNAPNKNSTTGTEASYIYHCKNFRSDIVDVKLPENVEGGIVEIYILLKDGKLPDEEFIQSLTDYLMAKERKIFSDKVLILAPLTQNYNINLTYYINSTDSNKALIIQNEVKKAIDNYINWQSEIIGRDIEPSKLIYLIMNAGAKRVEIKEPIFTPVNEKSIAVVNEINYSYGGLEK